MSDNVLIGLLVGLFIGGILGVMAIAVVATGSKQRFSRVVARLAETADTSGQVSTTVPVAEGDDLDQEMRDLMRRHGGSSAN